MENIHSKRSPVGKDEMDRRWRLILGKNASLDQCALSAVEQRMDQALEGLYNGENRRGGLGASAPKLSQWLGDIREFFPQSVVQVMQRDAVERLGLRQLLAEKELLETVVPDVHLVATLMGLSRSIPAKNKELARLLVRRLVDELSEKLSQPLRQAVNGALNRAGRRRNPPWREIDWPRTIMKNMKNYQPDYRTVIPELRIGFGRKRRAVKDIILALDQSGSMGTSVIYSAIFGAVLASLPSLSTKMVAFDTAVVDLTAQLEDPVDVLFGVQLGGGTDIDRALKYCQQQISRPSDTILVLVSDLYEGGNERSMRRRMVELVQEGVQFVMLLALNDDGRPCYDEGNAQFLASLGVPAFACTPDKFPDLMAAALERQDLSMWLSQQQSP